MAVAELVKTVDGLSPRQSFYVIFVSDKTYPMFYPQQEPSLVPATPANKKRLAEWAAEGNFGVGQKSRVDQSDGSGGVDAAAGRLSALGRRPAVQRDGATRCPDASHAAKSMEFGTVGLEYCWGKCRDAWA